MNDKTMTYVQLAEQTARKMTSSIAGWQSFLDTASQLYKYNYPDQMMIYAQRPEATACASYELWNGRMGRYVRRGAKGIALLDTSGENVRLRYVFDVSDTGTRANSRSVEQWKMKAAHELPVAAMLEQEYDVPAEGGISAQIEQAASQLASAYWQEQRGRILGIVDDSFLSGYDELNVAVSFRRAVSASVSYMVSNRCGLMSRLTDEDFVPVLEWNTPQAAGMLGTAVNQIGGQLLRQMERTIKDVERSLVYDELQASRRSPAPRTDDGRAGDAAAGQVRQDAQGTSEGERSTDDEQPAAERAAGQPSQGDRPDGTDADRADDAGNGEASRDHGEPQAERSDGVDAADERAERAGRGDDSERADLQLNFFDSEQTSLFATEAQQIEQIDKAESTITVPSASFFRQEEIDHILRMGSNEHNARMQVVAAFAKRQPLEAHAAFLKSLYQYGHGIRVGSREIAAWYTDEGIRIAKGNTARYSRVAQMISWEDAAIQIHELLDRGQFATNVELAEAAGDERMRLARTLAELHGDFSEEGRAQGYLPAMEHLRALGYPEREERIAQMLADPPQRSQIISEMEQFCTAYQENREILRWHYHRPLALLDRINALNLPHRTYETQMTDIPWVNEFITEDQIRADIAGGSSFEGGRKRIYEFFSQPHTSKEKTDFLKKEYGVGGRMPAQALGHGSSSDHDTKGLHFKKAGCPEVHLSWSEVIKRIDDMIRRDRYLSPEEKAQMEAIAQAHDEPEADRVPSVMTQDDIDDAFRRLPSDIKQKHEIVRYMREHGAELETTAWLAEKVGYDANKPLHVTRTGLDTSAVFPWDTVRQRIHELIEQDAFYTQDEQDAFLDIDTEYVREQLAERGIVGGEIVDQELFEQSPFMQQVLSDVAQIEKMEADSRTNVQDLEAPKSSEGIYTYKVGDSVFLEQTRFEITEIREHNVQLRDPSLIYPIFRSESKENLARLLAMDERNDHLLQVDPQPTVRTETVAVYPAEENHLPYDVVIQTIKTDAPEHETQPVEKPTTSPQIAPQKVDNFRIVDDHLGEGGAKAKFHMNMDAIHLLKELEANGRQATPEQQEVLSRYVGWGGLPDAFDESKAAWSSEYAELKAALTPEEYDAARASTLNAHYTSPTVIRAIYEAIGNMGFETGNVLEPAMGIGNFFGMLPDSMQGSKLYGVELDSITGRIAGQLYPNADITVAGFETTDRRDFFDVAVGNVPFGNYKVNDRVYNKLGFSIHDYFFAKTLDQVRPGGVIAFVTSRYTMDKQSPEVRKYIAQRAELLGAIRLPNNAFRANAGTDVVSDIIFLQKRERPLEIEPDWVHLGKNQDGFSINSYFVDHPEMVLGRQTSESTQYGRQDFTVVPIESADLKDQLHEAVQHIHGQYQAVELPDLGEDEAVSNAIPADPNVKNYSYTVVDGEVYYRENSIMVRPELNATAKERVKGLVALRECVRSLIDAQMDDLSDDVIAQSQRELNTLYDAFAAKYGLINDRANRLAFADDSSYYLLCSLEVLDEEGKLKNKAAMFTKRTIRQQASVDHTDTADEALAISIGERATVDIPFMAELTGKMQDEIIRDLSGVIFRLPESPDSAPRYVISDEYLSGNVREKLRQAQQAAEKAPAFAINVKALEAAQPTDLEASEIDVRLGATWIDKAYIQQFMYELLGTPYYMRSRIEVHYSQHTAEWNITGKSIVSTHDVAAYSKYGTDRANAYKILEDTLNLRDVRIYDTVEDENGKEKRVINQRATTLAQQKQQAIKDAFRDWIWKDPVRRQTLVALYNERFNSVRVREYDGRHITFDGMNPEIALREHQLNAVAHILYGGNTLLAHQVGAGKTFEMVAAAMESKRLGLCQKSLFVVPNHLTEQWASEFLRLYPSANILVTTKKDFEKSRRRKFCARIATGDYDAIIIGHSQFEKIPISYERQERLLQDQIWDIMEGIEEVKRSNGERFTIKQMERSKKQLELKLQKLKAEGKKDDVVTFEELGVDRLFVDEAHFYKNLFLVTKMRNVAGLSTSEAQKSSDMFAKCRYMDELTGGRGIIFATGTPVSNSMTEMYTIQRYLQYDKLQKYNMVHFDAWASTFGETMTAIELAPEGTGYRARTRFAKFFNLPELMTMFKEAADIKTADQLHLPTPQAHYETIVVQPTDIQKEMVQALSERAADIHKGSVDPSIDNMLKVTSDGRKLGLDQRLINPLLPDDPGSKVNACIANIHRIWQDGQADRLTQLVFCDISTPKAGKAAEMDEMQREFNVYDDIRDKLIARGVPKEEIAFIHHADTEVRKKELFAKVRSGQVRVLIGSTAKMGAGTNCQDRLIALHDLDCPWRPGDLEQRAGRIVRQGNQNKDVHIYRYVTEGTFDGYLWVRHAVA